MTKEKRLEELSEIAITVIKECFKSMDVLEPELLQDVIYKKEEKIICLEYKDGNEEYDLDNISSLLSTALEGYGPCSAVLDEEISLRENDMIEEYVSIDESKMTNYDYMVEKQVEQEIRKKKFMDYAGKLMYIKYRAPEVLEILRVVEDEASKLIERKREGFSTNLGILLEGVSFEK